MENTIQFEAKENIRYLFDLKGSTYGREYIGKTQPCTILKDNNIKNFINKRDITFM